MIEIMKPIKQKKLGIEAIHGHTIIELKDVRNGRRERIESDNIVTDGAESLLRSLGNTGVSLLSENSSAFADNIPICAKLFGGLLLFNDTIPTSPNPARFMPAGVKMLGNGSYKVSNSSEVTEMGSYNEIESSISKNKFEQVYDFSTQQANGIIKSVCLASNLAGYAGYGNSSSQIRHATLKNFSANSGNPMFAYRGNTLLGMGACFHDNKVYYIGNSRSNINANVLSVDLIEKACTVEEFSAFTDYMLGGPGTNILINAPVISTTPITLPAHTYQFAVTHFDNKLYLVPSMGTLNNGSSFVVCIIDCDTKTITTKNVTNNSGKDITLGGNSTLCMQPVDENTLFCLLGTSSGSYSLGVVNLTTGTVADSTKSIITNNFRPMRFAPNLILFGLGMITPNSEMAFIIYDTVNATFYPTNLNSHGEYGYPMFTYNSEYDVLESNYIASDNQAIALLPHPWRLNTINNLGSSVEKDATKTMKVTYTLTFS